MAVLKFPEFTDTQYIGVFSIITIILSIISFVGVGHLEGFLNETGFFTFGFFVFDAEVNAFLSPFAYVNLNPIRRFIHMIVPPSLIALIIISLEKLPLFGKGIQGRTIPPKVMSAMTMIVVAIQVIPPIFIEDHKFFSNPTWFSDWLMYTKNGYAFFTIVYVLSIFTGLMHLVFAWVREPRGNRSKALNATVSIFILLLSIVSFYGLFKFEGFFAEAGASGLDSFLLKYSDETPFQGFVRLFKGENAPVKRYTHLISIPGFLGIVVLIVSYFKRVKNRVKGDPNPVELTGVSKYSLLALILIAIQILPVSLFGYNDKVVFLSSPTWLSDILMNNYGYPTFTIFYFGSVIMGMIRAVTGAFIVGNFNLEKYYNT